MKAKRVKVAKLGEKKLKKVQTLEEELGSWVVALEPQVRLADLSKKQLEQLQLVEKELGVILLAYTPR